MPAAFLYRWVYLAVREFSCLHVRAIYKRAVIHSDNNSFFCINHSALLHICMSASILDMRV